MTKEKVEQFNTLEGERAELQTELKRIENFRARSADNKDNARAVNKGKIFTKFAGTAAYIPEGVFTGALNARKAEINKRLTAIESELNAL